MQVMFAMGMEEAMDQVQELSCRVAYQDDACVLAQAAHLIQHWPRLTEALEQAGHRMRQPTCTFWSHLCDTLRPASSTHLTLPTTYSVYIPHAPYTS